MCDDEFPTKEVVKGSIVCGIILLIVVHLFVISRYYLPWFDGVIADSFGVPTPAPTATPVRTATVTPSPTPVRTPPVMEY